MIWAILFKELWVWLFRIFGTILSSVFWLTLVVMKYILFFTCILCPHTHPLPFSCLWWAMWFVLSWEHLVDIAGGTVWMLAFQRWGSWYVVIDFGAHWPEKSIKCIGNIYIHINNKSKHNHPSNNCVLFMLRSFASTTLQHWLQLQLQMCNAFTKETENHTLNSRNLWRQQFQLVMTISNTAGMELSSLQQYYLTCLEMILRIRQEPQKTP